MKDLSLISTELFNKIRSRFNDIKLGDENSTVTSNPADARFFDVPFTVNGESLGQVNIKLDDQSLTVIFNHAVTQSDPISKNKWYDFLKELREFARSSLLKFDTRDISKSNLDKRDYQFLAQKTGESKMSESKLFGTSRTSYQDIGEAKLIVKHSQPVNYNLPAGRTMHIDSIYIESAFGERFRYPYKHLNGARALAVHVSNGGTAYDSIGTYISGLSEEMGKLRQFKNYVNRSGVVSEALNDITPKVLDRIDTIKNEIHSLQKQSYYETFKEGFTDYEVKDVPEDTVNQWVDALTIRTFNEELKSVFPYIYKLVDHVKPVLNYDDLVQEDDKCDEDEEDDEEIKENSFFDEFENQLDTISKMSFEMNEDDMNSLSDQELISIATREGYDDSLMFDNTGKLANRNNIINMLSNDRDTVSSPTKSSISNEVVEFIESMYDHENGTFPRGEEGVKIAVEKRFGEHAGKFAGYVVEKLSRNLTDDAHIPSEEEVCANTDEMNTRESVELSKIKELAGLTQ